MQMTARGLVALARHEGIVPAPYRDSEGIWTFGIGHTAAAGPPDPERMTRGMPVDLDAGIRAAIRLFRADIARYEADVRRAVSVPVAPHEVDALVSFHYNTGGIAEAVLTRHLNAGNRKAAAAAFLNWKRPAAIIPRRTAERDLFALGHYPEGPIPVWGVDRAGKVDFHAPVRRISEAELLVMLEAEKTVPPAPVALPAPTVAKTAPKIPPTSSSPSPAPDPFAAAPFWRWLSRLFTGKDPS
jgi:lysozyme